MRSIMHTYLNQNMEDTVTYTAGGINTMELYHNYHF
jgi:hypothetical protein